MAQVAQTIPLQLLHATMAPQQTSICPTYWERNQSTKKGQQTSTIRSLPPTPSCH